MRQEPPYFKVPVRVGHHPAHSRVTAKIETTLMLMMLSVLPHYYKVIANNRGLMKLNLL